MLEKWKHLLDSAYIGVLFTDLSKAFDVLNHSLLLAKLDAYGFSLKSTTFIQSYLNKRVQKLMPIINSVRGRLFVMVVPQSSSIFSLMTFSAS